MRCWQEQQLSSHREMYPDDGHECDLDAVARDAAAQTGEGTVLEVNCSAAVEGIVI